MVKQRQRRRQIVVDKKYQNRIIFAISWPPAVCLALTALSLGIFCWKLSIEALESEADLPSLVPVFLTTIGFLVIAAGFQFFSALKFSHRLAGPTVNIAGTIKRVQDGDLSARVHLRRGDFVHDVADEINGLLDWLEEHPPSGFSERDTQTAEPEVEAASLDTDGDQLG